MHRISISMISLALYAFSLTAAAGTVPDQAVKDADGGYFHKELAEILPLLKDHGQDPEVQFRYGQALLGIGKADAAITALKAAVSSDPKNGVYHRLLGEAYGLQAQQAMADGSKGMFGMLGLMKSARAEFESAATLAPADVQAHVDLASYYIMVPGIMGGSYSKAHDQEVLIDKLDAVQGLQVRASEAGNKDDTAAAEALLKQAVTEDKTADSLVQLGIFYSDAKRYDDALKTFRDAEAKDPKTYGAWYQAGKTAGIAKAHYDEGVESLKHYLSFADLPDTMPSVAWAHYRLGKLYAAEGQAEQAKTEYQTAANLNTDSDPDLVSKLTEAESNAK